MKGATNLIDVLLRDLLFQSTLPVKGATEYGGLCRRIEFISIHAPCEGSDMMEKSKVIINAGFQSTLPVKGATGFTLFCAYRDFYFNPRSL